jgi:hypothetical protein
MEPEGSLLRLQEPVICPCPEPVKSSPRPHDVVSKNQSKTGGFVKCLVRVLSTSLNLTAGKSPLFSCPRLLIQYFAIPPH